MALRGHLKLWKIALGQINPTVGDFAGNSKKIIERARQARLRALIWCSFLSCPSVDTLLATLWKTRVCMQKPEGDARDCARGPGDHGCLRFCFSGQGRGRQRVIRRAVLRHGEIKFIQSNMQAWCRPQNLDYGLTNSRFGVAVPSPHFFAKKKWTSYEFDSLVTREIEPGKVILPLWHKVSKDEPLTAAILLTTSGWTTCLSMKYKVQD